MFSVATCSTILCLRIFSLSMTLMATLSPVSLFLASLTLAKVPSPSSLPISYFPTRVRGLAISMYVVIQPLTVPVSVCVCLYPSVSPSFFSSASFRLLSLPNFHLSQDYALLVSSLFLTASICQSCCSSISKHLSIEILRKHHILATDQTDRKQGNMTR